MSQPAPSRVHGGPDPAGVAKYDFSTNSNACGPCPQAVEAMQRSDVTRYPDAAYHDLREQIASFHGVAPERVALAGSASEFIFRMTALAVHSGLRQVCVPRHAYGDYRAAAMAWGLAVGEGGGGSSTSEGLSSLSWACDPSSPLGQAHADLAAWTQQCATGRAIGVLDRAYEPLRLEDEFGLRREGLDAVWQLYSPNKALGLTGVRAAYAIAPAQCARDAPMLEALCPSWPLGAHAVALLQSWCDPQVQAWVANTRDVLRGWKSRQQELCAHLGWKVMPSQANFFCVEPGGGDELDAALNYLRLHSIKLRDATSFGLPGHLRLAVLPPQAQHALKRGWQSWLATR